MGWARRGALFVTVLVMVSAFGAPGSVAAPTIREDQSAWAFWSFPTGKPHHSVEYGALIYRTEDVVTGDVVEFAGFTKTRCVTTKSKNSTVTSCRGFSGERATGYYIDPMLGSAWLKGKSSRVDWVGSPTDVGGYVLEEWCGWWNEEGEEQEGSGRGAGRSVEASASGKVLDTKVNARSGRRHFAMLELGARVTDCPFLSSDEMADIADGRSFTYSYRTPRR